MENNSIEIPTTNQKLKLSAREQEVLSLLLMAQSNSQIAKSLFITERTVKYHCSNIYSKHSVTNKLELLMKFAKDCTVGQEFAKHNLDIIVMRETWSTVAKKDSVYINYSKDLDMRELTISELEIVSGGVFDADVIAAVGAVAGGAGVGMAQWAGLTATQQATVGGLFGLYGAALSTALYGGLTIGNWLNNNTPIQSWITNAIDELNGNDGDGE